MCPVASTYSHDSCFGCITNSESSEEFEERNTEELSINKNRSVINNYIIENTSKAQFNTGSKKCEKVNKIERVISSRQSEISNFSTNLLDKIVGDVIPLESDNSHDNTINRYTSKHLQGRLKKEDLTLRSRPQLELSQNSSRSPQISRVVNIVPKPKSHPFFFDYNIPDQSIGIPTKNLNFIYNCHSFQYAESSSFKVRTKNGSSIPKKISVEKPSEKQITHYPLFSGSIPSPGNRTITFDHRRAPLQQTSTKRDNGERNKVKFSNTVTVAVVPVS